MNDIDFIYNKMKINKLKILKYKIYKKQTWCMSQSKMNF